MNTRIGALALIALLSVSAETKADWSDTTTIKAINIGGNGMWGAFVSLDDFSFTGCSTATVTSVLLPGTDQNYKELLASLLAAKLADRSVRVMYSGTDCISGYPVMKEIVLP